MQKKYSIGFFVLIISIIISFSFIFRMTNQHMKHESEQEIDTKTQRNVETFYYIKEKDGYVIVYEGDHETVYEYTNILVESLPPETQKAIKNGIRVNSLSQIYGFLENYSS